MRVKAFTLAEVLITLGIIGIVAAITLPVLIQNYKKHVWVNQLKKAVSVVEQGFHKMLADEGCDRISDTEFGSLNNGIDIYSLANTSSQTRQDEILKNYFKIVLIKSLALGDDIKYTNLNKDEVSSLGSDERVIYLNDGCKLSIFISLEPDQSVWSSYAIIDVNGDKNPNQWGRDTFGFHLNDHGNLIPSLGNSDECLTDNYNLGCAKRIIDKGWKMDY